MAFNYPNYQPYPQYQNQYTPQQTQYNPQPTQQNNPLIWVSGEAGAKAYLVAPNTTLPLWDSESQTIYLKSADSSGMPSMKILDYTIRDNTQTQTPIIEKDDSLDYVTHEELKKLEREIKNQIRNLSKKEVKDE